MADWMEYMTSDTVSTLANERRKNGVTNPGKCHFFGIGNETWGCGGNMRPEYYADLFRQYATYVKAPRRQAAEDRCSGGTTRHKMVEVLTTRTSAGHGRHLDITTHDPSERRLENKGNSLGFPESEMDLDAGQHAQDRRIHHQQREGAGPERSAGQRWRSSRTSGARGTRPSRAANRDSSTSRTACATPLVAALNFHVFHAHAKPRADGQHRADGQRAAGHDPH
jgi:alpha-N-arabinofuranosidase